MCGMLLKEIIIPRTQLIQTRSALGEMRYYATDVSSQS